MKKGLLVWVVELQDLHSGKFSPLTVHTTKRDAQSYARFFSRDTVRVQSYLRCDV